MKTLIEKETELRAYFAARTAKMDKKNFMKNVSKDELTGCWIWIGSKAGKGYGTTTYNGERMSARKVAFLLFVNDGEPDPCTNITNTKNGNGCGHLTCVNPKHFNKPKGYEGDLFVINKALKRFKVTKLTKEAIIKEYRPYKVSATRLSNKYQVPLPIVYRILAGKEVPLKVERIVTQEEVDAAKYKTLHQLYKSLI